MNSTRQLALLFGLLLSAACGDDSSDPDPSTGGGAGAPGSGGSNSSGGSGGSGGSGSPGTGGSAGTSSSSGGAAGNGSGGAAGFADGGSSGSGGQANTLSFFATSKGSGELGGNLGGLEGADAICQDLADAAGAGDRTWAAYLSTSSENAVDRIGSGPWFNAAGDRVGSDPESLHTDGLQNGDPTNLVMDENGDAIPADEHDILTGSDAGGMFLTGLTCADWTSNDELDEVQVGHSDIPSNPQFSPSWNSAHATTCDAAGLDATGGAGRLYCFATD